MTLKCVERYYLGLHLDWRTLCLCIYSALYWFYFMGIKI